MTNKTKPQPFCPNCSSKNTIKRGKRKRKLRTIQQFQCKDCKKFFSSQSENKAQSNKTYPLGVILKSISAYNLGYNLSQTSEKMEKKVQDKNPGINTIILAQGIPANLRIFKT